jgi:hypothetical protein
MVRAGLIIAVSGIILTILGCGEQASDKAIYEQVKIYDLAPLASGSIQPQQRGLIEVDTHIFELPAEKLPLLADLWNSMLSSGPLRYHDAKAFKTNGFVAGAGSLKMWDRISEVLSAAEARKARTVSLLHFRGHNDYVSVTGVEDERQIFYAAADGKAAGMSLSNGVAAFRVRAKSIPGTRGAIRLSLQPVFRRVVGTSKIKQLAGGTGYEDIAFDSTGLEMQMSPGHFVLLGPGEHVGGQMSLSGLFFRQPELGSILQVYLILCRSINE